MKIDKTQWFKDWINNIEDLDIPKDWIDSTWHNDATCSFIKNKKQIWIDNKDVEQSTDYNDLSQEDYDRFHIIDEEDYGLGGCAINSNDFEEVKQIMDSKKTIKQLYKERAKQ